MIAITFKIWYIKATNLFSILVLIILFISCKSDKDSRGDNRLTTINNSTDSIFSITTFDPEDSLESQSGLCVYCMVKIPPESSYQHYNVINWETYIEDRSPQNTVTILIILPDTLRKYSFEQINSYLYYSARYDLTINELQTMDWKVNYP